jgi:hypothetical protein
VIAKTLKNQAKIIAKEFCKNQKDFSKKVLTKPNVCDIIFKYLCEHTPLRV